MDDQVRETAFTGKDALQRRRRPGCSAARADRLDTLDFVPAVGASIAMDGAEVGKVTSADRGYTVGKALALGYVASGLQRRGRR